MTLSREQLILEEIKDRLNGSALGPILRPAGLVVERSRLREILPAQLPSVSIYPMTSDPERKGFLAEAQLLVKIAVWVKGSASVPVDEDLDPIWLWVHQQLMTDESLGGLALRLASRPEGLGLRPPPGALRRPGSPLPHHLPPPSRGSHAALKGLNHG